MCRQSIINLSDELSGSNSLVGKTIGKCKFGKEVEIIFSSVSPVNPHHKFSAFRYCNSDKISAMRNEWEIIKYLLFPLSSSQPLLFQYILMGRMLSFWLQVRTSRSVVSLGWGRIQLITFRRMESETVAPYDAYEVSSTSQHSFYTVKCVNLKNSQMWKSLSGIWK